MIRQRQTLSLGCVHLALLKDTGKEHGLAKEEVRRPSLGVFCCVDGFG
jgi:hypothetical protein